MVFVGAACTLSLKVLGVVLKIARADMRLFRHRLVFYGNQRQLEYDFGTGMLIPVLLIRARRPRTSSH